MNSYIVLIAGVPGAGKTSFATYLSKELGITMVSKDLIKEKLFDTLGFKSRDEKVKLGVAATTIMYHIAQMNLEVGIPIILENNFEDISKPELLGIIEKYNCKVLTLFFYGEPSVIYKRFLERDSSPVRHRGHVVNTQYPEVTSTNEMQPTIPIPLERFYVAMKKRGILDFAIGDNIIRIDTTDFSCVNYDEILLQTKNILIKYGC